jgi:anti-anti-sigma factor
MQPNGFNPRNIFYRLDVLKDKELLRGSFMLRVDIHSAPPVVHLLCSGRLVLGVEAETLRCMATSRPERKLVLDLQRVHAIDAAGLGLLVELHCWARDRSHSLVVANPSPRVHKVITLTRLKSVLQLTVPRIDEIAHDEDESEQRAMTA